MTTRTWHTGADRLAAYVAGSLDAIEGASVEQHLAVCEECRLAIRPLVDVPALDLAWQGVREAIESPRQPLLIRAARRVGLSESSSVLLAATVSLRTAWLTSSLIALAFAAAAAHFAQGLALWPFLLVAPLIPVVGVAASYGPSEDPFEALVTTSPYGRTRLVLVRTLGVLAACLPVTFLISLLLPGPAWIAAAWLGPALALVPVLLALASFVGPRVAAGLVSLSWTAFVLPSVRTFAPTWPVEPQQQLVLLTLALAATAVLVVRSRRPVRIGAVL